MDASVRLKTSNLNVYITECKHTGGMAILSNTLHHTSLKVTHPTMFKYLPSYHVYLHDHFQLQATTFILFKTAAAWDYFLKWSTLCSLEQNCIAPKVYKKEDCGRKFMFQRGFSSCHRFDQSMMNILFLNWVNFDMSLLKYSRSKGIGINRNKATHNFVVNICKRNK